MTIRNDLKTVSQHLERLLLYRDTFSEYDRKWGHLKNKEDYYMIYSLDSVDTMALEKIYADGRDLAIHMSYKLEAFNYADKYPTLTSYVESFAGGWLDELNVLTEISSKAKQKCDELENVPWAIEQMIQLFDDQISLLEAVSNTLSTLKKSDLWRIENEGEQPSMDDQVIAMAKESSIVTKTELAIDHLADLWKRRKLVFLIVLCIIIFPGTYSAYQAYKVIPDLKFNIEDKENKISRIENENTEKTAEIQRLETLLAPFKTIAIEKYLSSDKEALQKLATDLESIKNDTQLLEAKLKDRTLSSEQQKMLITKLANLKGRGISFKVVMGDTEALKFARTLKSAFETAGWSVNKFEHSIFTAGRTGLYISLKDNSLFDVANHIFQAFQSIGFHVKGHEKIDQDEPLVLIVGSKP